MQVSPPVPLPQPEAAGGGVQRHKRTVVHDTAESTLFPHVPAGPLPSLRDRQQAESELFHYYATRGHVEVLRHDSTAMEAAPSGWSEGASSAVARPVGGVVPEGSGSTSAPLLGPTPGEPLFPRLRPSAADEAHGGTYDRQARDTAKKEALQTRRRHLAQPGVEAYYGALFTPDAPLTNHIRTALDASARMKAAEATAALVSAAAEDGSGGGGGKSARGGAQDRSARNPNGGLNSSMRSSSLQVALTSHAQAPASSRSAAGFSLSGGAAVNSDRRSPQADLAERGSVAAGELFVRPEDAETQAALLREGHAQVAKEIEDVFVVTHDIQHPEARARRAAEAEEQARRRSARAASLAMGASGAGTAARRSVATRASTTSQRAKRKSRKSTKSIKSALPRREGAPAANVRLFINCLLTFADEQGRISQSQFESVLRDVPFEVMNEDALSEFFALLRQFSQAKQREIAFLAAGGVLGGQGYADSSIVSTGSGPGHHAALSKPGSTAVAQSMRSLTHTRSGAMPATSSARLSIGSRAGAGVVPQGSTESGHAVYGNGHGNHHSPTQASAAAAVAAQLRPNPVVFLRELISAIDELINGEDTRDVVRWTCFNVLASSGQGYIHKSALADLRQRHREECESPRAEVTASMVKALGDCFDVIAQEEEDAYLNGGGKGKKKKKSKKMPTLAPNQKSVIPLSVMRVSHMDYATFCRFFEELPQVAAAFTHVWLSLLFTGAVAAEGAGGDGSSGGGGGGAGGASTTIPAVAAFPSQGRVAGESTAGAARTSFTTPPSRSTAVGEGGEEAHSTSASLAREVSTASGRPASARLSVVALPSQQTWPQEIVRGLTGSATIEPGTYPLQVLGEDSIARRATIQRIIVCRLECMKSALDEMQDAQQIDPTQGRTSMHVDTA